MKLKQSRVYYQMGKILKHIPVLLLWLAGLTLTAHQIIPHDHCIAESYSKFHAPVSNSHPRSGFPIHCHAFNDLVLEKLRPVYISHNIQFNFIVFAILPESVLFKLQVTGESIFDIQKPDFYSDALQLSSLRAPPSFV
jgi:hypothetical protein